MTVTCPKCKKSLKVKDEYAGKMLKCPQCQSAFKADAKTARPAGAAALKQQPKPGEKAKKEKAGVSINWGPIVLIGLLSLIPIAIILFIVGPMSVKRHWDANQEKVEGDVKDVIDFALRAQASQTGMWNPRKGTSSPPHVGDLRMLPEIFHMSTPETVKFDGFTSNGSFDGTYTFETGEVDVNMKIEGLTLASGIHFGEGGTQIAGGVRSSETSAAVKKLKPGAAEKSAFHITGRVKAGNPTAELDGKKAEILWPPELDEDGNPIEPVKPAAKAGATTKP